MTFSAITLHDIACGQALLGEGDNIIEIRPGLYFSITNVPLAGNEVKISQLPCFAALSLMLEGYVETDVSAIGTLGPDSLFVTSHDGAREVASRFYGGRSLRNVEVFVMPGWFDMPGNGASNDPGLEAIHRTLSGGDYHHRLPMQNHLRDTAVRMQHAVGAGAIAAIRIEAAALEFLAALAESFTEKLSAGLSRRDHDRLATIREAIETDPVGLMTIADLAQRYGVSASKLKRDFSTAYSLCIGDFIAEQRLLRARRMLDEGASVAMAAYAVGYSHPGNFSTAFKRKFGMTPRQFRA